MPAEHHDHDQIHLPSPSAQPILASLGVAVLLAGLVPESLLWQLTWMSTGVSIVILALWLWISDAIDEYRDLPD